jgi:hypothetical protein
MRSQSDGSSLSEERLGGVASGEPRASLPLAFELAAIAARSPRPAISGQVATLAMNFILGKFNVMETYSWAMG